MQYALQSHQQERLHGSCFLCMDIGSSKRLAMQNLQIPITADIRMLYWLLPSLQKQKGNRLATKGDGFLGVTGGSWGWGRPGALLQHRQPPSTDPLSSDSINPKISAFSNVTLNSLRSSTVITLDWRNGWAPRRNSIKASAPFFKEHPLPFTPSFWERVAPSTTITRRSLLRSWVLILKDFRNWLPSFMLILSITLPDLSIPDVSFQALLSPLIRRRFQVKPATLLVPVDLLLSSFGGGVLRYRYQSGSFC